jgi:hypothetical protein
MDLKRGTIQGTLNKGPTYWKPHGDHPTGPPTRDPPPMVPFPGDHPNHPRRPLKDPQAAPQRGPPRETHRGLTPGDPLGTLPRQLPEGTPQRNPAKCAPRVPRRNPRGNNPGESTPAPRWTPKTSSRGLQSRDNPQRSPYRGHSTWFPGHRNRYRGPSTEYTEYTGHSTDDPVHVTPSKGHITRHFVRGTSYRHPSSWAQHSTQYRGQNARDHTKRAPKMETCWDRGVLQRTRTAETCRDLSNGTPQGDTLKVTPSRGPPQVNKSRVPPQRDNHRGPPPVDHPRVNPLKGNPQGTHPPGNPQRTDPSEPSSRVPFQGDPTQRASRGNPPQPPVEPPKGDSLKGTSSMGPRSHNNLQNNRYGHRNRYRWHHTGDPLHDTSDTRDILQGILYMWPYPRDTLQDTSCRGPPAGTTRFDALHGTPYRGQNAWDHEKRTP